MANDNLTFSNNGNQCSFLDFYCRDGYVQDESGARADYMRTIFEYYRPYHGAKSDDDSSMNLLHYFLTNERVQGFVGKMLHDFGFGNRVCSVEARYGRHHNVGAQLLIDGLGPDANCDQVQGGWQKLLNDSTRMPNGAIIGLSVAVGFLLMVALIGYTYLKCQETHRTHRFNFFNRDMGRAREVVIELDDIARPDTPQI